MDGQPVWLASLSKTDVLTGRIVPNGRWSGGEWDVANQVVRRALGDVGDPSRERLFRMNITLCLHRAATAAEVASLPAWWHAAPANGIAGPPLEVLSETVPGSPSTRPCAAPAREWIDRSDPLMWIPGDCGRCVPCRARAAA